MTVVGVVRRQQIHPAAVCCTGKLCSNEIYDRFVSRNIFDRMQFDDIDEYCSHFQGRILRQPDTENLKLSMLLKKKEIDGTLGPVIVDKDIPIGKYLEENGYDMHKPILEDIRMDIDYSRNSFMIKAKDWEATYKLVEEI